MPFINTKNLGRISYEPKSAIEFPLGLPGFEDRRQFLAITFPHTNPLVFLQSVEDPDLCFITAPVRSIDPGYRLAVHEEDLASLGLDVSRQPAIGADVLCLAVVSVRESGPTANLLAPIVVNIANLKAVQAIAAESGYSHQHPVVAEPEPALC